MKILFFLVVLTNIGVFLWEYRTGAFAPVKQATLVTKEPLLLVSELPPPSAPESNVQIVAEDNKLQNPEANLHEQSLVRPDAINVQTPDKTASTTLVETLPTPSGETIPPESKAACYEAGPFDDTQIYSAWRSQVNEAEENIKSFDRDDQIISSYMVYYPAEKSLEQAQSVLKMFKEKGITDVLLQGSGKEQGEISLGVFNSEDRALVLKNELSAKGIEVQIKPRYKSKSRKYVQVFANDSILASLQRIQKNTPDFTIKPLETCP